MATTAKPASSWRDTLPIHPAAELFPLMTPDEQRVLGEDIKKNGLASNIAIVATKLPIGWKYELLDGRNRLDAMEAVGIQFRIEKKDGRCTVDLTDSGIRVDIGRLMSFAEVVETDPYAFVISANIHRRHLDADDKRKVIADLLKAQPEKSDRQIGGMVKADHHKVGKVRKEEEDVGNIPHVETRTDTEGRRQPARKRRTVKLTPEKIQQIKNLVERGTSREKIAETIGVTVNSLQTVYSRLGISTPQGKGTRSDSAGELARLRARVDELGGEKRRLEIKIKGLESEIEELRQPASEANGEAIDADAATLGVLLKTYDRASEPVREKFMARFGLVRDPLAIPPFQDRRRTREARP